MHPRHTLQRLLLAACLCLAASLAHAQTQAPAKPYEPTVGQAGKNVVWVPTPQTLVDKMLDMAQVTARDYVIDLGSGDGRTVITAAKRGAHSLGIEYNPDMVELSKRNAEAAGVTANASFVKADLFESDFSKATVITMFLLPSINMQLRPKLLDLAPGTRIVSNSFRMEEWEPDESATVADDCVSYCTAYFWMIPAKVAGAWRLPQGDLTLTQNFQVISGTLGAAPITNGKLRGNEISFSVGDAQYTGRVSGASMEGTVKGGTGGAWSATRR